MSFDIRQGTIRAYSRTCSVIPPTACATYTSHGDRGHTTRGRSSLLTRLFNKLSLLDPTTPSMSAEPQPHLGVGRLACRQTICQARPMTDAVAADGGNLADSSRLSARSRMCPRSMVDFSDEDAGLSVPSQGLERGPKAYPDLMERGDG